jgi:predicted Fe-Mo cluster-binding NifX family protein
MIFLIVGVDRHSLASWHTNLAADDVTAAKQAAHAHARGHGVELVVAAVIGPNSTVLPDPLVRVAGQIGMPVEARSSRAA